MTLNIQDRIDGLKSLQQGSSYGTVDIPYGGRTQQFQTYEIDLDLLVYNPINGRILQQVQNHVRNVGPLDPDNADYEGLIEGFIWEDREKANKDTYNSLLEVGQLEPGVVSLDGIIVSGNRRASLINKINKDGASRGGSMKFKAAILPVRIKDDQKAITLLEKKLQHGIESQVGYLTLNKYLEIEQLTDQGLTDAEIIAAMPSIIKDQSALKDFRKTKKMMDEYLKYIDQPGQLQLVGKSEDLFTRHTDISRKDPKTGAHAGWDYREEDVSDLQFYLFDYARSQKGGPMYRDLSRNSDKSFFYHKEVWEKYKKLHADAYQEVEDTIGTLEDKKAISPDSLAWDLINQHEKEFQKEFSGRLEGIYKMCNSDVFELNNLGDVLRLARSALKSLERIDTGNESFKKDNQELVSVINDARKLSADLKKQLE